MNDAPPWRPTASIAVLRRRAEALAVVRDFFCARNVLEVETPAIVNSPVSDVNLGSVRVEMSGRAGGTLFLHTSPEYAMKRLLAAGSGDIYQLCHVFRGAERGRQHNPEFTLLEWYRLGFSLEQLMDEVAMLVQSLLGTKLPVDTLSYREALRRHAGFDPLDAGDEVLRESAQALGLDGPRAAASGRDELLDLIVGAQVGPALGAGRLTFLHRYPASQAALARLDPTIRASHCVSSFIIRAWNWPTATTSSAAPPNSACASTPTSNSARRADCPRSRSTSTCWQHSTRDCRTVPAWRWDSTAY